MLRPRDLNAFNDITDEQRQLLVEYLGSIHAAKLGISGYGPLTTDLAQLLQALGAEGFESL